MALLQQGIVFILALLMLDMEQTICEAITAIAAYCWHLALLSPADQVRLLGAIYSWSDMVSCVCSSPLWQHCRLSEGH
jgi:hypothetical protein